MDEVATGIMDTMAKPASIEIHVPDKPTDNPVIRIETHTKAMNPLPMTPAKEREGRRRRAFRCSVLTENPALNRRIPNMSKLVVMVPPWPGRDPQSSPFSQSPGDGVTAAST